MRHYWLYAHARIIALGLSTIYSGLYLFAVLCLATGIFHPTVVPHSSHQHDHHEDHPATAHHGTNWPDLCDFALQTLTTPALHHNPIMPYAVLPGERLILATNTWGLSVFTALLHIRAPPADALLMVAWLSHIPVHT